MGSGPSGGDALLRIFRSYVSRLEKRAKKVLRSTYPPTAQPGG